MPLGPRLVLGLLGMLAAGVLSLVFRRARPPWGQWAAAAALTPAVIVALSALGLNSGQRTRYVFWGAVVGILCVRGDRSAKPIPAFAVRSAVVFVAFVVLGPAVGLLFHWLRYQAGIVALDDDWEIGISLEDGAIASAVGCLLAGLLVLASAGGGWGSAPSGPATSPSAAGGSAEPSAPLAVGSRARRSVGARDRTRRMPGAKTSRSCKPHDGRGFTATGKLPPVDPGPVEPPE